MGIRILVVDDSRTMRRIIIESLKGFGVDPDDIDEAEDGDRALVRFTVADYDLVITDWNMPKLDGFELLTSIRERGCDVPIVMVTTEAERTQVLKAIDAGVSEFLIKPFSTAARMKLKRMVDQVQNASAGLSLDSPFGAKYVNPFLAATMNVFQNMLGCELARGEVYNCDQQATEHDVSAVTTFSGRLVGTVVLSMNQRVALNAASKILGRRFDEIDADVVDMSLELASIIVGNAHGQFDEEHLSLSTPKMVLGAGRNIDFPGDIMPIMVPYGCRWGPLSISVGLTRAKTYAIA